jgi:hypothetical protein
MRLPELTLAYPNEESISPGLDKRSKMKENVAEKVVAGAKDFK